MNIDPYALPYSSQGVAAEQVHETGAIWHRLVLRLDRDVRPYCDAAHGLGGKVLGVLDSDSLGLDPALWFETTAQLAVMYGQHVEALQIFNEPDAPHGTHGWPLPIYTLCKGIEVVVSTWCPRAGLAPIYGPGLSNSKPWYLDKIDWASLGLDGIACQGLYGRWPTEEFKDEPACRFGSAPELLDRFTARAREQGLKAIVSEWGYRDYELPGRTISSNSALWRHLWNHDYGRTSAIPVIGGRHGAIVGDMSRLLAGDKRFEFNCLFCASDLMVPGFGLLDKTGERKVAWHTFRAAQKEEEPLPEPDLDLEAQLDQRINAKIRVTPFAGAEYLPRVNVPGLGRVAFTDAGLFIAKAGVPGCYLLRDEIMPVPLRG